jgi:hypothetical protein
MSIFDGKKVENTTNLSNEEAIARLANAPYVEYGPLKVQVEQGTIDDARQAVRTMRPEVCIVTRRRIIAGLDAFVSTLTKEQPFGKPSESDAAVTDMCLLFALNERLK